MKALFLTTSLPHRPVTGAEQCSLNFIDAMRAAGIDVTVLGYLRSGDVAPDDTGLYVSARDWPIEISDAGGRQYVWLARSMRTGRPFVCEKFRSRAMDTTLRRALSERAYDLLVIDHAQMGWVLDYSDLPLRKILIAHNSEARLYSQMARTEFPENPFKRHLYMRDAQLIEKMEARLCQDVDQIWAVTTSEAADFKALHFEVDVRVFDIPGADLSQPSGDPMPAPQRDISILGAWGWEVNRAGLAWFMGEVVPRLPRKITIGVAGNDARLVANPHANVTYHGFVEDAGAFLRGGRLVLLPTIAGAGVQLKTIAAIASGMPTIGTDIAYRGITEVPDTAQRVPVDAEALAKAIQSMLDRNIVPAWQQGRAWYETRRDRFLRDVAAALNNVPL